MDGSECGRGRPGFGCAAVLLKLLRNNLYIVVPLLGQFSKETVHKTASISDVPRQTTI